MKTTVVLFLAIVAQAVGNVLLTREMKAVSAAAAAQAGLQASALSEALAIAVRAADRPEIWTGAGLVLVYFVLCSVALSWADASFVLPVTTAGYVLNVAAGWYFLNEDVTAARWLGAVVITIGVVFVSQSPARTTLVARPRASGRDEGTSP